MFGRILICRTICAMAVVALTSLASDKLHAQIQPAGVDVDPDGVLRTRVVHDPTGQLTRQRLQAAKAALAPDVARSSKLRKVSLNRLEAAVSKQLADGHELTQDMQNLAGLTRIQHVFLYPDTGDIVIAGPAEGYAEDLAGRMIGVTSGRCVLQLEDLVTALRAFPPTGDPSKMISVSIDPTREGLARMQQFLASISGRVTPRDVDAIAAGLRKNLGLQTVTIKGIPANTHFAQVLVEADYRMKLIGIGLEKPPVNITSYVQRANPRDVARNAMQRWYFTPDYECVRVSEDELAMELVGYGVRLISENERVTADGGRASVKHMDRASRAFVTAFTEMYPALAQKSPVFGQLRNLIDMLIAAAFMQQHDYYGQADWHMEIFASETQLPVETLQAPRHVETAVNAIWKGGTLMTPVGGGVNIQPRIALEADHRFADENAELAKIRSNTTLNHLVGDQWWWD